MHHLRVVRQEPIDTPRKKRDVLFNTVHCVGVNAARIPQSLTALSGGDRSYRGLALCIRN